MVTYKVFDKKTGKDITNTRFWVIGSDGTLYYDDYDLIRADSFAYYVIDKED